MRSFAHLHADGVLVGALRVVDVVGGVEPPRPLHGAGAKDERAAASAVQHERVRARRGVEGRPVVDNRLHVVHGGRAERLQRGRPPAVVHVFVPLVAEDALLGRRIKLGA